MWNYICCPSCDYTWTFSLRPPPAPASASYSQNVANHPTISNPLSANTPIAPGAEADPLKLNILFGELDKFCSYIRSIPGAASHPDVKQQLDFITASKEKLTLALAEQLAHQHARQEQLANALQAAKQREEAERQRIEELARPSPPLDGNALGQALLKNLGLSDSIEQPKPAKRLAK
jgi:hypothetical protein